MRAKASSLRVLHVIESLGHGGAEHQLSLTVRGFDPDRVRSFVCALYGKDVLAPEIESAGVPVYKLGLSGRPSAMARAVPMLAAIVRRTQPDLIHTSLFQADVVGGVVGRAFGVPVVGTICSRWGEEQTSNQVESRVKLETYRRVWGAALRSLHSHSIAISEAVRENAVRSFGISTDRVSIVYRALDDLRPGAPLALSEPIASLAASGTRPIFVNVGRLVPSKGQLDLLRAMSIVVRELPDARLLIVGDGWFRGELESARRDLNLEAHVQFLGARNDVPAILSAADAFVFPSLSEGLGVALVEAVGAGLPCVTTNVPPMTEVVRDGVSGICVPPSDPTAMAGAMLRLANDRELAAQMGRAARRLASERFDRRTVLAAIENVYGRVVSRQLTSSRRP